MSCEGKEKCPVHGTRYMRRRDPGSGSPESYCAGCHAGEMAAEAEYYRGVLRGAREMLRRGR